LLDTLLHNMTPAPTPPRVLLVDDDAMMRELLEVLFQTEGYAVQCAFSGDDALALLRSPPLNAALPPPHPTVILTDMQMPGTTGAPLAAELRRLCPSALLLAMSGSDPAAGDIALYDGFLMKPFAMQEFHAIVSTRRQPTPLPAVPDRSPKPQKPRPTRPTPLYQQPPSSTSRGISLSASADDAPREEPGQATTPPASPQAITPPLDASNPGMNVLTHETEVERHHPLVSHPAGSAPVPARNAHIPALNEEIYLQLTAAMPVPQLREMYTMCLNDARRRIASMRSLAAAGETALFTREAHSIKGGSGMLGATELHTLASHLEKAAPAIVSAEMAKDRGEGAKDVNSLDELAAACDRLERILGSLA